MAVRITTLEQDYTAARKVARSTTDLNARGRAGWVTDVPGVTAEEARRLLGNGVVPQQAAAAVSQLLPRLMVDPDPALRCQET